MRQGLSWVGPRLQTRLATHLTAACLSVYARWVLGRVHISAAHLDARWRGRWGDDMGGTLHTTRMAATQPHSHSAAGERQQGDEPFQGSLCKDVAVQPEKQPVCFAVESLRQPGESSAVKTPRQHHRCLVLSHHELQPCVCQVTEVAAVVKQYMGVSNPDNTIAVNCACSNASHCCLQGKPNSASPVINLHASCARTQH